MDSETKFAKIIVGGIVVFFLAGMTSCTTNSHLRRNAIVALVEAGASPVAAMCAVDGVEGTGSAAICAQVASK